MALKYTAKRLFDLLPNLAKKAALNFIKIFPIRENDFRRLNFEGPFHVSINKNASFKMVNHGYLIENNLFWAGFGNGWEATSLRLWLKLCQLADVIVDIGANTGVYSLSAHAVNPKARVIAFEPIPMINKWLNENVDLNHAQNISVVCAAISNLNGKAKIFDTFSGSNIYTATLSPTSEDLVQQPKLISIEIKRFDDYMLQNAINMDHVLVKIDTERHERQVLEGFGDIIRFHRPTFLIEILSSDIADKVSELINSLGYQIFQINEGVGVRRVHSLWNASNDDRNFLICTYEIAELAGLGDEIRHDEL